ncbi:MAG: type II secretion system protein, partial [Planctomycetes bacterium]|nr:type II secretion system protein [Planctomycetota bacterium]
MRTVIKQFGRKKAFTIVELLTVMSIIVILISLLVPSLNKARQYAFTVRQHAQFHSIDVAMELFRTEFDGYPNSNAQDETGAEYCGAMKLAEAMVGWDLLGFHPDSDFMADGDDAAGTTVYDNADTDNLRARKGPYLPLDNANAYSLDSIYTSTAIGSTFDPNLFVLCDVYKKVTNLGNYGARKLGMPILYYRANTSGTTNPTTGGSINSGTDIYNYLNNDTLVGLGVPFDTTATHPMDGAGG